jgi:allophanate hydrolase
MTERGALPDLTCLDIDTVARGYRSGRFSPGDVVMDMVERSDRDDAAGVWIHRASKDAVARALATLEERQRDGEWLPLYGVAFAVKDNIDVAGMPTTAACPAFSYVPARSAAVVERLIEAGAIVLGKTNLDQFATGLVGTRSPYGTPRNPFDARFIPGGSSSGSAVAVARGLATFALGTDTAGSGRVPAGFNNIVGLKPSRGLLSTTGVVPACRTLDCVSIFALTCPDAWRVFEIACHFDAQDPLSRRRGDIAGSQDGGCDRPFRFGVPADEQLDFQGDQQAKAMFTRAVQVLQTLGGEPVVIDFSPFREVARMLYDGPWVAERLEAAGELLARDANALDPNVRAILQGAAQVDARAVFRGQVELARVARQTRETWRRIDVLAMPTTPTIYSIADIAADPIGRNRHLGYYTNFVNLLDLAALAVPVGLRPDGLPSGVTLAAPSGSDAHLIALGRRFHARSSRTLGATRRSWRGESEVAPVVQGEGARIAVVGAHLSGEPLNWQLTELGGRFVKSARTASRYRLFSLPNTTPAKPGLVRTHREEGHSIELEVWWLSLSALGAFLAGIRAPLCIGSVELEDGDVVHGFLCEPYAVVGATDISKFGGWRAYRRSLPAF